MNNLAAIVAKIRERSEVPILIYNLSPIIPGDRIHCYAGLGETFCIPHPQVQPGARGAFRKQRNFDHRCRHDRGAAWRRRVKLDAVHLKPQGYSLVAREVVRVLDDLGVLETAVQ